MDALSQYFEGVYFSYYYFDQSRFPGIPEISPFAPYSRTSLE